MSDNLNYICVNEKQAYHNCELVFSFYYDNKRDFKVDEEQKYKIHTTIKEVELLNEALNVYQEDDFKKTYLLFTAEIDGSLNYPDFVPRYNKAKELAKQLQALSNDEDSLVQLSEYCLEVAPTYEDDFGINKKIDSITIDTTQRAINGYEDLKAYISELKKEKETLFI